MWVNSLPKEITCWKSGTDRDSNPSRLGYESDALLTRPRRLTTRQLCGGGYWRRLVGPIQRETQDTRNYDSENEAYNVLIVISWIESINIQTESAECNLTHYCLSRHDALSRLQTCDQVNKWLLLHKAKGLHIYDNELHYQTVHAFLGQWLRKRTPEVSHRCLDLLWHSRKVVFSHSLQIFNLCQRRWVHSLKLIRQVSN